MGALTSTLTLAAAVRRLAGGFKSVRASATKPAALDATLADMAKRNQLPKFEKVMADKTRKRRR